MKTTIERLEVMDIDNLKDVAVVARINFSDAQDALAGSASQNVHLAPPDPQNFKPYPDIKEADAIGWALSALKPDELAELEASVQYQIDQQQIPQPKEKPLPWKSVTP